MQKLELLYSGKAKSVYQTSDPDHLIIEYRDDASAFDGKKLAKLERKGLVNNQFNDFIMRKLDAAGVATHHVKTLSATQSLVKKLAMIPVECVVRNVAAGSITRRLGVKEGTVLNPPTFEFFLKNDALGDPMINEFHMRSFAWASDEQIVAMRKMTFDVNRVLFALFDTVGLTLVDYKLEFGVHNGQLLLGDEFSPDGCRLWDKESGEKMDKDRFRQDLGSVIEAYEKVGQRFGIQFSDY